MFLRPAFSASLPRPAFHCAPSPLKRKTFFALTLNVVSCAPAVPMMTVSFGCAFAYWATAIDSSPESGPMRTSAFRPSTSLFVSLSARAAVSSPQPIPTSLMVLLPTFASVIPADGFLLFFGLAPAYWLKAAIVPAMSWS